MQFVDGACDLLMGIGREGEGGAPSSSSSGWFGSGRDEERERERRLRSLRTWLEAFVSEEFLPEVYVDFRHDTIIVGISMLKETYAVSNQIEGSGVLGSCMGHEWCLRIGSFGACSGTIRLLRVCSMTSVGYCKWPCIRCSIFC